MATRTTTRTTPLIPTGTWIVDPGALERRVLGQAHGHRQRARQVHRVRGHARGEGGPRRLPGARHVKVASIDTGEAQRDEHLRSADFFDVEQFPEITFESTRVEAIDDESSRVYGNLTMHGITREIRLDVLIQGTDTDPWGNTRAGLEVVGTLKRSDFDMKFNQALGSGNVLVGDKVASRSTSPRSCRPDRGATRKVTVLRRG